MKAIDIIKRDMTQSELARMNAGFEEIAVDNGVIPQGDQRFRYMAMDRKKFIGCVSGLAYKNRERFNGWCYLTDLYIKKEYRQRVTGTRLLNPFEELLLQNSIDKIWMWTAG